LKFWVYGEKPYVIRLGVHLPNEHTVLFQENDNLEDVIDRDQATTLTMWFAKNQEDVEARQYLYSDFPQHYTWNKGTKKWSARKRNVGGCGPSIGRLYLTHPGDNVFVLN
jgi:hypothetical protein